MIDCIFKIRLCTLYNLIFFALLFAACTKKPAAISIIWKNDRATGISIPVAIAGDDTGSLESKLSILLATEGNTTPIAGSYQKQDNTVVFEPLIPFTRGLSYDIILNNTSIGKIKIPEADQKDTPELLSIYPAKDTLPENLLKMHFRFSKPMREGYSIRHLTLIKNMTDTLKGTFLDLQPELWNEEGTLLTLWLDPGRIKRDLHPNQQLGTPLQANNNYTLLIAEQWKDKNGTALVKSYRKDFVTTARDSISPDPKKWSIKKPSLGSRQELLIQFHESLDYNLATTTLHITDKKNTTVTGVWKTNEQASEVSFITEYRWTEGDYLLQIETRLEDLAGNNINRAFDVDVRYKAKPASTEEIVSIPFTIIY